MFDVLENNPPLGFLQFGAQMSLSRDSCQELNDSGHFSEEGSLHTACPSRALMKILTMRN